MGETVRYSTTNPVSSDDASVQDRSALVEDADSALSPVGGRGGIVSATTALGRAAPAFRALTRIS